MEFGTRRNANRTKFRHSVNDNVCHSVLVVLLNIDSHSQTLHVPNETCADLRFLDFFLIWSRSSSSRFSRA